MPKSAAAAPTNITSVLHEDRVFKPAKEFSKEAHLRSLADYRRLYHESIKAPEKFWGKRAKEELVWHQPFSRVLQFKAPNAKWFLGGKLNVSTNCLDRHLEGSRANKAAIIWEGEPAPDGRPGEERVLTFRQLHREVCRFANVLKRNGVKKGDRVLIYLPMVPEAAVAMQACARIGAVHSVVFGGFSAQSVADRIHDCGASVVVTSDGGYRRGAIVPLKKNVDDALKLADEKGQSLTKTIRKVIVLRRTGHDIHIEEGRDVWWHRELEYVSDVCPASRLIRVVKLFIV
jgi:acetyl-CoA synthetase